MIGSTAITEIFSTYKKHGWILRRVLLSPALKTTVAGATFRMIEGVKIVESDIDAAWFSRPPASGGIAWELRYLGDTAFALLANIDEAHPEFEESLEQIETRLRESIAAKISA